MYVAAVIVIVRSVLPAAVAPGAGHHPVVAREQIAWVLSRGRFDWPGRKCTALVINRKSEKTLHDTGTLH